MNIVCVYTRARHRVYTASRFYRDDDVVRTGVYNIYIYIYPYALLYDFFIFFFYYRIYYYICICRRKQCEKKKKKKKLVYRQYNILYYIIRQCGLRAPFQQQSTRRLAGRLVRVFFIIIFFFLFIRACIYESVRTLCVMSRAQKVSPNRVTFFFFF